MTAVRIVIRLMVVMIVPFFIPCLVPAEIGETVHGIRCCTLIKAQHVVQADGDTMVDISACQNACRGRYGSPPPTGFSDSESPVSEVAKELDTTIEQSSPALYLQCMQECERNYWGQFEDDAKGTKRRR